MRKNILLLIPILCGQFLQAQTRLDTKDFKNKLAATPNGLLLDIRTAEEINKGYLKGAVFIDFYDSAFKKQVQTIDKNKPVFVYCAIGGRSWDAAKIMTEMGFKEVYDLKGGIIVWKIKNYPYVKLKNDSARQGMNKSSFEKMIERQPLVFVDFYAAWCGPCTIMVPALDSMEKEMKDSVLIVKINADENLQLMKDYNLGTLPYIMVFENSKLLFTHDGFMSGEDMRKTIRRFYKN